MVEGSSAGVLGWAIQFPGDADMFGDQGHFPQTKSWREIDEQRKQNHAQRKIDDDKCSAWRTVDYYMTDEGQLGLGEDAKEGRPKNLTDTVAQHTRARHAGCIEHVH